MQDEERETERRVETREQTSSRERRSKTKMSRKHGGGKWRLRDAVWTGVRTGVHVWEKEPDVTSRAWEMKRERGREWCESEMWWQSTQILLCTISKIKAQDSTTTPCLWHQVRNSTKQPVEKKSQRETCALYSKWPIVDKSQWNWSTHHSCHLSQKACHESRA